MNDFLRRFALDPNQGKTYVIVPEAGSREIMAYYTLWPDPPVVAAIPPDEEVEIQAIWLKRLAVATAYQRQGIGKRILIHVIRQTLQVADVHPLVESLVLEAIDQRAKDWYLRCNLGFREFASGSLFLALPVATMRQITDSQT